MEKQKIMLEANLNLIEAEHSKYLHKIEEIDIRSRLIVENLEKLKSLLVEESEANSLVVTHNNLKNKVKSLKEEEHAMHTRMLENAGKITHLKQLIQHLDKIIASLAGQVDQIG